MATKKRRGFAAMDPAKVREIARRGGTNNVGRHRFTHEEAVAAGHKGGMTKARNRKARDRAELLEEEDDDERAAE